MPRYITPQGTYTRPPLHLKPGARRLAAAPVALVAVADQTSKAALDSGPLNRDLFLGIPAPTWLAIALSIALLVALPFLLTGNPWAVGLVMGGIIGNLLDRLALGGVRDFIPVGPTLHNIADLAIYSGLIWWALTRRGGE